MSPVLHCKKTKPENIEFSKSTKNCILKGYRACKVCHPLELLNETLSCIKQILDEFSNAPGLKFKDYDLRLQGVEPNQLRHRIIGADGSPTGYDGDIWCKKWLLESEKQNS